LLSGRAPEVVPEGRIPAAVLVPLHWGPDGLEVWAIRRTDGLRHHAREIAFPGGKPESQDLNLEQTALREAEEELGVARRRLHILGRLRSVPTATSRFLLYPFLATIEAGAEPRPNPAEVAELIRTPLLAFFDGRVGYRAVRLGGGRLSPIFDFRSASMYGASAHVLLEVLQLHADCHGLRLPRPGLTDVIPWQ
jgi:8-oxo-dGTP pyrophosphatase MutT (NUDIX family)